MDRFSAKTGKGPNFPELSSLNVDHDPHWKTAAHKDVCCYNGLAMCKLMRCLWQRCALTWLQKLGRGQGVTQLLCLIRGTKTNIFRSCKWTKVLWTMLHLFSKCHKLSCWSKVTAGWEIWGIRSVGVCRWALNTEQRERERRARWPELRLQSTELPNKEEKA